MMTGLIHVEDTKSSVMYIERIPEVYSKSPANLGLGRRFLVQSG